MAAISFFGYFFLGLGPGIVFYLFFIAPKSFVVLLSVFSAFLWLVVLLVTSAIFRAFVPLAPQPGAFAGMLVATVFIEEVVRYGVWRMHRKTMQKLESMSRASGHTFSNLDHLYLALGWGYGHGACHVLFFFASLLPLTAGDGTFYTDACPAMSIFLVSALNSLGFGALLTAVMVVALDGWSSGNVVNMAFAPVLHLAASLVTVLNLRHQGCLIATPIILGLGAFSAWYAGTLAWQKGAQRPGQARPSQVLVHPRAT